MGKSARSLWTAKLTGKTDSTPLKASWDSSVLKTKLPYTGIILGIDPSLRGTGLALIEFNKGKPRYIKSTTLKLNSKVSFSECIGAIFEAVTSFIESANIRHVALEQTIYVQNHQTAQILGAARGAAIAAAAVKKMAVFEYPPMRIKQAVVGFGRASKEQMIQMLSQHMNLNQPLLSDEADAAGVALCHAFSFNSLDA